MIFIVERKNNMRTKPTKINLSLDIIGKRRWISFTKNSNANYRFMMK